MPRTSSDPHVHRDLNLVSPLLKGSDVHELQRSLNALVDHYKFPWHKIRVDAEFGRRTARQSAFVANLIGLEGKLVEKAKRGHLSKNTQHLLRNPQDRTAEDRVREERRRPAFKKLRKGHEEGMKAAVDWELKHVGVHEQPPESNHGPFPINECQAYFGLSGVPWCGCLAGYAIEKVGGIDTGTWWPYAGSIREDAIAGRNGLTDINPADADIGCVVTFFSGGDDHVGLIRAPSGGNTVYTVEGNTSSAKGRNSDGGIIETRERSFSEVTVVARLTVN